MTMRLGFVTGSTPDKWARAWRDRFKERLELIPLDDSEQAASLSSGAVDMALVRLPVAVEDLHTIRLYDELPVVVAGKEHVIAAVDEHDHVLLSDLDDEQLVLPHASGWSPSAVQLAWPAMTVKDAIETVSAGTGIVVVPMSVARLFHRKDVVHRVVDGLDATTVALVWPRSGDDERTQAMVGIMRGRTANSSRG
jgi:DNA-binding transcriptional LysR family regulator